MPVLVSCCDAAVAFALAPASARGTLGEGEGLGGQWSSVIGLDTGNSVVVPSLNHRALSVPSK